MYTQQQHQTESIKSLFTKNTTELFDNMEIKQELKDDFKKNIANILKKNHEIQVLFWEIMNMIHFIPTQKDRNRFIELTKDLAQLDPIEIARTIFNPETNFPQCDDKDIEKICAVIRDTVTEKRLYHSRSWISDFMHNSFKMLSSKDGAEPIKYHNTQKIIKFPLTFLNTKEYKEKLNDYIKNIDYDAIDDKGIFFSSHTKAQENNFNFFNQFQDIKILFDYIKNTVSPKRACDVLIKYLEHMKYIDISNTEPIKNIMDRLKTSEISLKLISFLLKNPQMRQLHQKEIQHLNLSQIKQIIKIKKEGHKGMKDSETIITMGYSTHIEKRTEQEKENSAKMVENCEKHLSLLTPQQKETLFKDKYYNRAMDPIHKDINALTQKSPEESKKLQEILYEDEPNIFQLSESENKELINKIFDTLSNKRSTKDQYKILNNWNTVYKKPSSEFKNKATQVFDLPYFVRNIAEYTEF